MNQLIDESAFDAVFDTDGNKRRLADFEAKQGPWIMRYEYNGDHYYTNGRTKTECRQRALIKTGGDNYYNESFEPEKGWVERGVK